MTAIRRIGRPTALAVAGLLAACQPLPHPFADDRPPADLLTVRDTVGVSIAPIDGQPPATTAKLGTALASALLKREIPASDKTTSLGSYRLYGRVAVSQPRRGDTTVVASWQLYDAAGRSIGEPTVKLNAPAKDWEAGDDKLVERLAVASAEAVGPLLQDEAPPAESAAGAERTRVAVGEVKGAPGDGGQSLAKAIAAVLKNQDVAIVEAGKKADLTLEGEVTVAPPKADKQHVKIVWRLLGADGAEIGTVGQENDIPRGLLDGAWGDVAYNVALAAGDGLMALVARSAPERKS